MTGEAPSVLRFAVYASGRGSNFAAILRAWRAGELQAEIELMPALLLVNRPDAGALEVAAEFGIPSAVLDLNAPRAEHRQLELLSAHQIDRIALAGYLRPVPEAVVAAYRDQILNIHPGPLPRFGGHKMYGKYVHQAVLDARVPQSGPTVHRVDEVYDRGAIVAHQAVPVRFSDSAESLAKRVLAAEHDLYARALRWDWAHDLNALLAHQRAGLSLIKEG